jgi:hypothetical protein
VVGAPEAAAGRLDSPFAVSSASNRLTSLPGALATARTWDALPRDLLARALRPLVAADARAAAAAAAACSAWRAVLVGCVTEVTAPLSDLVRALARFPAATAAAVPSAGARAPPPPLAAAAAALAACPRPLARLALGAHLHMGAAALCQLAAGSVRGAAWAARLGALELDLTFVMALPPALGAALPGLHTLHLRNFRNGGPGLAAALGPGGLTGLRALALAHVYCGAMPQLGALSRLTRLEVAAACNLQQLPAGPPPPALQVRGGRARSTATRSAHERGCAGAASCCACPSLVADPHARPSQRAPRSVAPRLPSQVLSIRACPVLSSLGLVGLPALTHLAVVDCPFLFWYPAPWMRHRVPPPYDAADAAAVPMATLAAAAGPAAPAAAAVTAAVGDFVAWADSRLPGLGGLARLRCLDLSCNAHLRRLPLAAGSLPELTCLILDDCRLLDNCRLPSGLLAPLALAPAAAAPRLRLLSLRGAAMAEGGPAAPPAGLPACVEVRLAAARQDAARRGCCDACRIDARC